MDLGSVRVKIEGDSTKLQADLKAAETAAANAGGKIAQAFNKSADSIKDAQNAVKAATLNMAEAAKAFGPAAATGNKAAVSSLKLYETELKTAQAELARFTKQQATSATSASKPPSLVGAIPGFGVAAERFIGMVPGLGGALTAAFPVFGAAAFLAVLDRIGPKIMEATEAFNPLASATKRAEQAAKDYNDIIRQLTSDIKELNQDALEFALGKANAGSVAAANKMAEVRSNEGMVITMREQLRVAQQIEAQAKASISDVPAFGQEGGGGIVAANAAAYLTAQQEVLAARKRLDAYEKQGVELQSRASKIQRDALLQGVDDRKKAGDESDKNAKRHTQEMAQADQLALAELKSNHQVTIGEEIKFYQQRLAVESANTERHRDITMKLGTLNQERNKLIESIAKRGADVMDAEAKKAQQHVAKFTELALESEALANRIAADMVKAQERAQENQTMRTAAGAEGAAEGRKLQNERAYGLAVVHTLQQQVQHMRDLAQFDAEKGNARIAELQSLQKIAEAAGDETKAAQYSLQLERERAAITNQQYAAESAILELKQKESAIGILRTGLAGVAGSDKTITQKLSVTGVQLAANMVDGLASTLARAAVEGGKLGHMLRDVGKQLAMTAATSVLKMGLQAALQGILKLIPAFAGVATAQVAAAATSHATTSALNVGSVMSYAAVGAAAAAASTAAIPIVGPLLAPAAAAATYAQILSFAPLAAFADGGRPEPGKMAIVGERGPELFIPDQAGRIVPNHMLTGGAGLSFPSASAGGNSVGSMSFHAYGMTNPEKFVDYVAHRLPDRIKKTSARFSPAASR